MTHAVRKGLIGEPSSNTFTNTRKEIEEMAQRLYIFGAKRFEDPGAMYLEETIGIVRSLVERKERNERSIRINTETKVKNDTRVRD